MRQKNFLILSIVALCLVAIFVSIFKKDKLPESDKSISQADTMKQKEESLVNHEPIPVDTNLLPRGEIQTKRLENDGSVDGHFFISADKRLVLVDQNGNEKVVRENVDNIVWSFDESVFTTSGASNDLGR